MSVRIRPAAVTVPIPFHCFLIFSFCFELKVFNEQKTPERPCSLYTWLQKMVNIKHCLSTGLIIIAANYPKTYRDYLVSFLKFQSCHCILRLCFKAKGTWVMSCLFSSFKFVRWSESSNFLLNHFYSFYMSKGKCSGMKLLNLRLTLGSFRSDSLHSSL